jgi:hypothetical protein
MSIWKCEVLAIQLDLYEGSTPYIRFLSYEGVRV